MSSVQELRFAPSSAILGEDDARKQHLRRKSSWRATTTPEGKQYFYNTTTKEWRWEPPAESQAGGLRVGTHVRVFSNSHQQWCDGYVERVARGRSGNVFTVAFKPPVAAQAAEWVKKELPAGHKDLWCATSAPTGGTCPGDFAPSSPSAAIGRESVGSPEATVACSSPSPPPVCSPGGFQETSLPTVYSADEQECYDDLFVWARRLCASAEDEGGIASYGVSLEQFFQFMRCSGLPNRIQKEVFQASNPDLKSELGVWEFRAACRLVAHCQALLEQGAADEGTARLLKTGGGALRSFLRRFEHLGTPPGRLPEFKRSTDG